MLRNGRQEGDEAARAAAAELRGPTCWHRFQRRLMSAVVGHGPERSQYRPHRGLGDCRDSRRRSSPRCHSLRFALRHPARLGLRRVSDRRAARFRIPRGLKAPSNVARRNRAALCRRPGQLPPRAQGPSASHTERPAVMQRALPDAVTLGQSLRAPRSRGAIRVSSQAFALLRVSQIRLQIDFEGDLA